MDLKDAEGYPIVVGDSYVAVTLKIGAYVRTRNGLVVEATEDKKGVVYTIREWRADDFTGKTMVCRPESCVVKTKPEELTLRIIATAKRKAAEAANPQPKQRLVKRGVGYTLPELLFTIAVIAIAIALCVAPPARANDVLEGELEEAEIEGRQIPWEPTDPYRPVVDRELDEAICRDLAQERGLSPEDTEELCAR